MKKIIITLAAIAAAFTMVSCDKEIATPESNSATGNKTVIFASTEHEMTKTALNGNDTDGYEVVWTDGDSFKIGEETFTLTGEAGKTSGTFEGTVPADGNYTVYYPSTYNGTDWPAAQTYVEGNIAGSPMKAEVTVSGGKVPSMEFKNEGGILRITVKEPLEAPELYTIKSVEVSADQLPASITLDCGDGVELDGSLVFNIAMPAGTYTGVVIKISTTGPNICTKTFKGTSGLVIERSKITAASFTANFEYGGLCFTALEANSGVGMYYSSTMPSIKYSLDGITWTDFDIQKVASAIKLENAGDKIYFCGENENGLCYSTSDRVNFAMEGSLKASGNIMSLIDPTCQTTEIPNNYCFYGLFSSIYCQSCLTSAPELPATTLTEYCYSNMFNGCTNLTTAPELPATTLANYCYQKMFYGCTNLTAAPELPATTLKDFCYQQMFYKCTALTTAPELPATTLVKGCYNQMFNNCKNLNCIKVHFTNHSASSCLTSWLSLVASSGTFYKPSGLTDMSSGGSGIPSGWTVVDF